MKKLQNIAAIFAAGALLLGAASCSHDGGASLAALGKEDGGDKKPGSVTPTAKTYTLTPEIIGTYSEEPAEGSYSTEAYGEIFYLASGVTSTTADNIKTNGKLQGKKAHIKFTTTGPATVKMNFKTGSSSQARGAAWASINGTTLGSETKSTETSTGEYIDVEFSIPDAGTYAIGTSTDVSGGIVIKSLEVTF